MNILIIGQGIAGSCLSWELEDRGISYHVVDRPIGETASRVAAGLVNPMTGRVMRAGWRQQECMDKLKKFYPVTEDSLGGKWWEITPIFRELETDDQREIWSERQHEPETSEYAGPLFPWPKNWDGKGDAAYVRGSDVLHVEYFVNPWREHLVQQGKFTEAEVDVADVHVLQYGTFEWNGPQYNLSLWGTGWVAGLHPDMAPV